MLYEARGTPVHGINGVGGRRVPRPAIAALRMTSDSRTATASAVPSHSTSKSAVRVVLELPTESTARSFT